MNILHLKYHFNFLNCNLNARLHLVVSQFLLVPSLFQIETNAIQSLLCIIPGMFRKTMIYKYHHFFPYFENFHPSFIHPNNESKHLFRPLVAYLYLHESDWCLQLIFSRPQDIYFQPMPQRKNIRHGPKDLSRVMKWKFEELSWDMLYLTLMIANCFMILKSPQQLSFMIMWFWNDQININADGNF